MKYTFHIVDVFSSTPFGGNHLAVLPEVAGISTEGMQKSGRELQCRCSWSVKPGPRRTPQLERAGNLAGPAQNLLRRRTPVATCQLVEPQEYDGLRLRWYCLLPPAPAPSLAAKFARACVICMGRRPSLVWSHPSL